MPRRSPVYAPLEPAASVASEGVLTLKQAAAFAGVSVRHLEKLTSRGVLPSCKPGKRRVIPKRALVAWLERQLRTA